jgi:hypothetical protein
MESVSDIKFLEFHYLYVYSDCGLDDRAIEVRSPAEAR